MRWPLHASPVPFPDLQAKYHYDAALVPNSADILIDQAAYFGLDRGSAWQEQRLRFSIAHELGHLFMHRKEIEENQFSSFADFKLWTMDPTITSSAEYQSDEFAGRLLVPRENLLRWYDHHLKDVEQRRPDWRQQPTIRSHLAKIIAPRFGVTRRVIETRFDRESIWPAE